MAYKIGIMGGTFNPIHIGHLIIAENAYEEYQLDKIWFMPSKRPPHKENKEIVSENDRLKMIEMAIENNSHFSLSTIELERDGTTYTIDTIKYLIDNFPENEYYFIIGADSLFQLTSWNQAEELFKLVPFLVATRDEASYKEMQSYAKILADNYGTRISFLTTPNIEISSSMIRKKVQQNKSISYFVPDCVQKYILFHKLYEK